MITIHYFCKEPLLKLKCILLSQWWNVIRGFGFAGFNEGNDVQNYVGNNMQA